MDPAWWAIIVAVVAAVPSWVGVGAAWVKADMADGRAERAEARAEGALEAYQRMADALDRLADRGDEQGGVRFGTPTITVEPPVAFSLEWRGGSAYTLRNLGPVTAVNVRVDPDSLGVHRNAPDGVTLRPLQGHTMMLLGTLQMPLPDQLEVSCDQLDQPVLVPVPTKF